MIDRMTRLFSKPLPKDITREDIESEDNLAMRARMLNRYLGEKWRKVEKIIGSEFPDDVDLEMLVEELWEDIQVAQEQIASTYGIAVDRDWCLTRKDQQYSQDESYNRGIHDACQQFKEYLEDKRQKIVAILEDITEEDARYFALYQRYIYLGIIINELFRGE